MNRSRLEFCCCVKDSAQTTVPALEDGHEHDMISGKHEGLRWKAPLEIIWSSALLKAGSIRGGSSGLWPSGFEYLKLETLQPL